MRFPGARTIGLVMSRSAVFDGRLLLRNFCRPKLLSLLPAGLRLGLCVVREFEKYGTP